MDHSPAQIALPEDCGLDWALKLHEEHSHGREWPAVGRVDVQAVRRITTPVIQLLISYLRAAAERGHKAEITGHSPVFDSAIEDLGLLAPLQQWSTRHHG